MGYRLSIAVLAIIVLCSCAKIERKAKEPAPIRVETIVVQPQAMQTSSRYIGTIEASRETPLSMQSAGRVTETGCRNGERVRKGQVLLRIDSTQAGNALRSAEASLRHAEDGYNRAKQVYAKGAVTDQQMVEIESKLTQAQSMVETAQRLVEECTIYAPFDGVVSGFDITVGQTVSPGIKLFSLLDLSSLIVRFGVPESEINSISNGRGEIEVPAINSVLPIRITEKSVSANPVTHSYSVTAEISGGTRELMPGMVGKVTVGNQQKNANTGEIIIPAHCVLLMPQGPTVWVIEAGKAARRDIIVDGYLANGVRVKEGLQAGDRLVVEGFQKLYKGCQVTE